MSSEGSASKIYLVARKKRPQLCNDVLLLNINNRIFKQKEILNNQ